MAFQFKKLEIPDIMYIVPDIYKDPRGYFSEVYKYPEFKHNGISGTFVQVNHSKSTKNTLRGVHWQEAPKEQGKLVTVVEGEVFDVAVDVRPGSTTFGKWVACELSAQRKDMMYIPEGFAHGFSVTSDVAQVIYYCTNVYSPEHERGFIYNDPDVAIPWPVTDPILSEKDKKNPTLKELAKSL